MQNTIEFCVYGGFDDEVSGFQEYPPNSLLDENVYYSAPLDPAYSGNYVSYLNGDNVYNSGYYLEPSYQCYYSLVNYEYYSDNVYYPYQVYVPIYYYFVPIYYYDYYLPRFEYVASSSNCFEQDPFDERSLLPSSVEPNLFGYEECDSTLYNNEYRSFGESVEELVGEEITSFHISYAEYPANLDEAGNEDEEESLSSEKNQEENIVTNGSDVNEFTVVGQHNEQLDGVYMNICDEDVEENIIKKVSFMSLVEVQQDVDETYEYGKATVYNEVLKGYIVNKGILEELEWECHTLEDIPEEEEPETDSDEMDFDENVLECPNNINLKEDFNKNYFPDVEEECNFVSESLSDESIIASSEEALVENYPIMMEGNQTSMDSSIAAENDKTDPSLALPLSNEKLYTGSINGIEEPYPPLNSLVLEENYKDIPVPDPCLSKQEIDSRALGIMEDDNPTVDSAVVAESHKINAIPDVCANKEKMDSGTESGIESIFPSMDSTIMEESYKTNSIPDLCLSKEEIDSVSLGQDPHGHVSSEDRGEEAPAILAPAATETKKRKKRFSSLRKFFGRICCCVKKPS